MLKTQKLTLKQQQKKQTDVIQKLNTVFQILIIKASKPGALHHVSLSSNNVFFCYDYCDCFVSIFFLHIDLVS